MTKQHDTVQPDLVELISTSLGLAGHPHPRFWVNPHTAEVLSSRDASSQIDAVKDIWFILLCKCSTDTSAARFTLGWGGEDIRVYADAFTRYVRPVVMENRIGFDLTQG